MEKINTDYKQRTLNILGQTFRYVASLKLPTNNVVQEVVNFLDIFSN